MERIKIALCITELNIGGAEKAFTALVLGMDRTRFEPEVYTLRARSWHYENSFLESIESAGIPVHFLDISGAGSFLGGIFRFKKMLCRQKPDLLQTYMFHANFIGRLAARLSGVPFVCSGIRVAEKGQILHLFLDRITTSLVDRYVCVSDSVAEFIAKRERIPSARIKTITNGIAPQEISPENDPTARIRDRQNIIYVGRLTEQKGLDWLLSTVSNWLDGGRRLIIVGGGPDRARLEKMTKNLESGELVRFYGWRPDIPELLQDSDLLVLPSRWEGMPNVVMEAMSVGLPVLCTRVEGIEQILGDLTEEQTCEFGKTEEFLAKIDRLLDRSKKGIEWRQKLGRLNRKRIAEHFSIEQKIEEYEDLWQDLYNQKKCNIDKIGK